MNITFSIFLSSLLITPLFHGMVGKLMIRKVECFYKQKFLHGVLTKLKSDSENFGNTGPWNKSQWIILFKDSYGVFNLTYVTLTLVNLLCFTWFEVQPPSTWTICSACFRSVASTRPVLCKNRNHDYRRQTFLTHEKMFYQTTEDILEIMPFLSCVTILAKIVTLIQRGWP